MIVVADASVLVASLVDQGDAGFWAESWIASGSVIGPELLPAEVINVLMWLERTWEISAAEAATAHGDLLHLPLRLFPFAPLARRAWALRNNLSSYDAWYVALAEASNCPLVTMDTRLARAPGPECEILLPPTSAEA